MSMEARNMSSSHVAQSSAMNTPHDYPNMTFSKLMTPEHHSIPLLPMLTCYKTSKPPHKNYAARKMSSLNSPSSKRHINPHYPNFLYYDAVTVAVT